MAFDSSTIATLTTTATLTTGVFTDTFIVGFTDVDMIRIELMAGAGYNLDVDFGSDFLLRVFDAFGNEVFVNDDGARANDDGCCAHSGRPLF